MDVATWFSRTWAPATGSGRRGAAAPRAGRLRGRRTYGFAAPAGDRAGGIMRATSGSVGQRYGCWASRA